MATTDKTTAGTLTMVAGYNFAPPTVGVVGPVATPYTLGAAGSGNINLPTVTINTSSTAGSAGGVLLVANGFVSVSNINASAPAGLAGAVTIIGQHRSQHRPEQYLPNVIARLRTGR